MISRGQDEDDIELMMDVKSDNEMDENSTNLTISLLMLFLLIFSLMLEVKENLILLIQLCLLYNYDILVKKKI